VEGGLKFINILKGGSSYESIGTYGLAYSIFLELSLAYPSPVFLTIARAKKT
jgi:hypothetical protein